MFTAAGKSAASSSAVYVEDVFSTYVYTGTSANRSIVNGIDLAGKGGLVWIKDRNLGQDHSLFDTSRGINKYLSTNQTNAEATAANSLTAFNSNGFNLGTNASWANVSPYNYVAWTFREQAKFFDVVTWTGDGTGGRQISHNLQSVPGFIVIKCTSTSTTGWPCWHRGDGTTNYYPYLNLTSGSANSRTVTSTYFTVNNDGEENFSGRTYVAYLFAHNAGGFGATGADNVISCGSYTGNGSATGPTVTLGYEPQWLMVKRAVGGSGDWVMLDTMRGFSVTTDRELYANLALGEGSGLDLAEPNATGFQIKTSTGNFNSSGNTYIYIAVRRGPMRTPTSGTSVFSPVIGNSSSSYPYIGFTTSFTLDAAIYKARAGSTGYESARLTSNLYLQTTSTAAEASSVIEWDRPTGFGLGSNVDLSNYIGWMFQRAPGFMDVVCYSNAGAPTTVAHNLGVEPELIITKRRNGVYDWIVYSKTLGASKILFLNLTTAETTFTCFANVGATSFQTFSPANDGSQVAYLFASCPGVSKVGSYTGTGALQTINCGFASGARFVLIKRTDSTGDWWVYDSTRGITSGNDPYLFLNDTAAEVTNTNYVDTTSVGFQVTAAAPAGLNANGGTYIFLAIA
jgi:hypothetical protein